MRKISASPFPAVDNELVPLGDVPLAPLALTGRSESELAQSLAESPWSLVPSIEPEEPVILRDGVSQTPASSFAWPAYLAGLTFLMAR